MKHVVALAVVLWPAFAVAQVSPPDAKKVTEITEAARICGFDRAGVKWKKKDQSTVQIWLSVEEMQQTIANSQNASPSSGALKNCFFPWAYDRQVGVEMNIEDKKS